MSDNSPYSGVDQEPNGRPIPPAGAPASDGPSASAELNSRGSDPLAAQDWTRADELARLRMEDEGAAATASRYEQEERARAAPPSWWQKLRRISARRAFWRRLWN
jgi:hypothetical protein